MSPGQPCAPGRVYCRRVRPFRAWVTVHACTGPRHRSRAWLLAPRPARSRGTSMLSLVHTWPVAIGLLRDIPNDLGDPLLNCWILGGTRSTSSEALQGDYGALSGPLAREHLSPGPYTLAYSELFLAQAVQVLPVYARPRIWSSATTCCSCRILPSGLGCSSSPARTRRLACRLSRGIDLCVPPYRVNRRPTCQVMSSQWMPFALFGSTGSSPTRRLAPPRRDGGTRRAEPVLRLLPRFLSLFVPGFVLFEVWRPRAGRDGRTWVGLGVSAVLVAACTLPAMTPLHVALRELRGTRRSLEGDGVVLGRRLELADGARPARHRGDSS